jgi:hypothetical protein
MRILSALLLLLAICPPPALAWSKTGHQLVCGLAEAQLSPTARRWLASTLALGDFAGANTADSFAAACVWPDAAKYSSHKGTYEQHYINIAATAKDIDLSRDCPAMDCLATGLRRNLVYLAEDAQGKREGARKAAALGFLGHFMADLHQPLHVSHSEDWGGNKIAVKWPAGNTNLHSLWDQGLLETAGLEYPASLSELARMPRQIDNSVALMPWLRESYQLALTVAYVHSNGRPIRSGDNIEKAYIHRATPIVTTQLNKAAGRLANLLEQLANGSLNLNGIATQVFAPE